MINFNLDSKTNAISFSIHPSGEEDAIEFSVKHYKLLNEGEKVFIELSGIDTNREWMNIGISNFIPDPFKIELPSKYEKLIRLVM